MCDGCGGSNCGGEDGGGSEGQLWHWLRQFDGKLERIDARLDEHNATLVRQEANLQTHMKRSDLLESGLATIRSEMKPLATHVAIEGAIARWVFSGGLLGAAGFLLKLLHVW